MTATFVPDPAVKQEFDLLIAVFGTLKEATERAKEKYCEGVPATDPETSAIYEELNDGLEQANLFDDHIRQHHLAAS